MLEIDTKNNDELDKKLKRRSQTYHANFKSVEKYEAKSKKSQNSKRSARLLNPFLSARSKVMSSSSTESEGEAQFHLAERLNENSYCITEKAVNLNNAK